MMAERSRSHINSLISLKIFTIKQFLLVFCLATVRCLSKRNHTIIRENPCNLWES